MGHSPGMGAVQFVVLMEPGAAKPREGLGGDATGCALCKQEPYVRSVFCPASCTLQVL